MKKKLLTFLTISFFSLFLSPGPLPIASAEMLPMTNDELSDVNAKGSISLGYFDLNDNHQFDSSLNKGAIIMDDNVMQYATGEVIVNATQSAISTGVISVGDITNTDSGTFSGSINITNTNESTTFIGGF